MQQATKHHGAFCRVPAGVSFYVTRTPDSPRSDLTKKRLMTMWLLARNLGWFRFNRTSPAGGSRMTEFSISWMFPLPLGRHQR